MFNLLFYQNLSSCSSGSFFPPLPLAAATFCSHIFTHNKVIIAPITAPNTRLPKNLPDGDISSHAVKKMSLAGDDLSQSVMIAVYIPARNAAYVESISYPESSGFLVSGATPGRLWGHRKNSIFLIGCSVTVSIVLPQKSCGNKIRCPQSLPGVAPLTKKPEDSGYEIVVESERTRVTANQNDGNRWAHR